MDSDDKEQTHVQERKLQEISLFKTIPFSDHQRWWTAETVAVVTGGNRGIGFEITRQLATHGIVVVLTSRDTNVGLEAAKVLKEADLNVNFHQLDIVDPSSIQEFTNWIQETYGGIDILVNNAGVNYNLASENSTEFAKQVINTNYFGTKSITKAMIPLMRPSTVNARIVNISSRLGRLNGKRNRIGDEALREKLSNTELLTEEVLDEVVNSFLEQVQEGTWGSGDVWPKTLTDYSVSKLAINCYTRVLSKELADRPEGHGISVNCYCPGWVKTALTGWAGSIPVEHGADTGVWLALLPVQPASGKFFAERREINF